MRARGGGLAANAHLDPARTGIGLRARHYAELLERRPAVGFLEVHAENYFGAGGAPLAWLERLRALYPLSVHGVGLSLGGTDPLDARHLDRLAALVERFEPARISDHLCWSSAGGVHLNDLLPLPCTEEALDNVVERVGRVQDRLGRRLLVENVSSYLRFRHSTIPEWEFLAEVSRRSGCDILFDVNNAWVSACNHGYAARAWVDGLPASRVTEMHLAGHAVNRYPAGEIRVDTHGAAVAEPVWALYRRAAARFESAPALIEWDTDVPDLGVLLAEAARADAVRASVRREARYAVAP